ncbi:Nonaspanin [Parasponia andersonii]|uniref:Transmembrane 9 superfamily member n=1 Tax=Parasponia andersonii TaxID=3476 RepID=A0A2P5E112_PARAD|nr:Nonaspanin [Parasponia andersonii]
MELVLLCMLFSFPLLLLGGIVGKNSKIEFQAPCQNSKAEYQAPFNVTHIPRDIPPLPWYRRALPQMAFTGILPLSAIYFELFYIILSMWGHRIYVNYTVDDPVCLLHSSSCHDRFC